MEIYCLCTGNVCRSPVAAALLAEHLARRGVDASVTSAGVVGRGQPASEHSVALMAEREIDLGDFRSSLLDAARLRSADLVLGMARSHVREAVVLEREVWPRAFTIKELVRRGGAVGPRALGETVGGWLARAHDGRVVADILGDSPDDDVADPIGRPRRAYVRMVEELDSLVTGLVELLWPEGATEGAARRAERAGEAGPADR